MKVLFVGGYGNISWWCTKRAIEKGHEVYLLNRDLKTGTRKEIPSEAKIIVSDYRNFEETKDALEPYEFDCVCDFICFNKEHATNAIKLFKDKTKQYIFISSESVYKRTFKGLPYTESSEKYNEDEVSDYIGDKVRCEKAFIEAFEKENFPITIVRPGLTYDTIVPVSIGHNCFTIPQRCLDGKPLLIAGEGNALYTFTHSSDFASAFVELIGNKKAIGEDFHITTQTWRTWNEASNVLLDTLKITNKKIIHIPFDEVLKLDLPMPSDLMYQRMLHNIFDLTKIRKIVPNWEAKVSIEEGYKMTIDWLYESDKHRRFVDNVNQKIEAVTNKYI